MNLISTKDIQSERLMDRQKRLTMYPFSINTISTRIHVFFNVVKNHLLGMELTVETWLPMLESKHNT